MKHHLSGKTIIISIKKGDMKRTKKFAMILFLTLSVNYYLLARYFDAITRKLTGKLDLQMLLTLDYSMLGWLYLLMDY